MVGNRTVEEEEAQTVGEFKSTLSYGQHPKEEDKRKIQCVIQSQHPERQQTQQNLMVAGACRDRTGYGERREGASGLLKEKSAISSGESAFLQGIS